MSAQHTTGERTPVTVGFVDISRSTALYVERGDVTAAALTLACLDIIGRACDAGGGRVLRRVGDGVLATFDGPAAAFGACVDIIAAVGRLTLGRAAVPHPIAYRVLVGG